VNLAPAPEARSTGSKDDLGKTPTGTPEPLVSVIVPAWNVAHCLGLCLQSVRAQTLHDWEAIVVDDGSTDNTYAVASAIADPRLRVVQQPNAGQGAARNRGLECARGRYVAFLDADDEWRPAFLEKTVRFLENHPPAVAVSTAFVIRYVNGREVIGPSSVFADPDICRAGMLEHFFEFWATHDHVRTGTALIRRAVIEAAGPQRADLRISQDLEYWGYLATFGAWGFLPEPLWVGNSRTAAAVGGWLKKYRARRRLCPTIEAWQSRILPRLGPADLHAFEVVRGRVAAGLAHHMIIGGALRSAQEVMRAYGDSMPSAGVVRLLRSAARAGWPAWLLVCGAVRAREYGKALKMSIAHRSQDAVAS
jgi:hypothetical protein